MDTRIAVGSHGLAHGSSAFVQQASHGRAIVDIKPYFGKA